MATGQTLLDTMELLDQELQLQAAEADVTRGLIALNRAQDYFESIAATRGAFKEDTTGNVTTTASTETTAFPTSLLRLDRLQYLDPTTSRPVWNVDPLYDTGGHAPSASWPHILSVNSTGKPVAYWTQGRNIYWDPLPDGTHTVRWYGFASASDISAGGTFAYADLLMLPLASFAVKLMRMGVNDPVAELDGLAAQTFVPAIDALNRTVRDGAQPFLYKYTHRT